MAESKINPSGLLLEAVMVSVVGGILSLIVGLGLNAFSPLLGDFASVVLGIVAIVAIAYLAKSGKLDNKSWIHALVFILAIGVVGSIVTMFAPFLSNYILSFNLATPMGFAWSVVYVLGAEAILAMLGRRN